MREVKSLPFALFQKDSMSARSRAGIFAVTGNRDSVGDRLQKGCFTKTFKEQRRHARHLWNHDFSAPPTAKVVELYEIDAADLPDAVREFAPDATGGAVVVREYLDTPRADEILKALDAGAIDEMSFAFDIPDGKSQLVDEMAGKAKQRTRLVYEVKHYESSDVLWGANSATLATRSAVMLSQLETLLNDIKSGRRSDDDADIIERIHALTQSLGAKCLHTQTETEKPDDTTTEQRSDEATNLLLQLGLAGARLKAFNAASQPSRS